jgi:hypothetical protein
MKKEEPWMSPERFKNSPTGQLVKVGDGERLSAYAEDHACVL